MASNTAALQLDCGGVAWVTFDSVAVGDEDFFCILDLAFVIPYLLVANLTRLIRKIPLIPEPFAPFVATLSMAHELKSWARKCLTDSSFQAK
jgi:hypothetical protein